LEINVPEEEPSCKGRKFEDGFFGNERAWALRGGIQDNEMPEDALVAGVNAQSCCVGSIAKVISEHSWRGAVDCAPTNSGQSYIFGKISAASRASAVGSVHLCLRIGRKQGCAGEREALQGTGRPLNVLGAAPLLAVGSTLFPC
jgi:hypothetical protein